MQKAEFGMWNEHTTGLLSEGAGSRRPRRSRARFLGHFGA